MYCGMCGSRIKDEFSFCGVCGAPVNSSGVTNCNNHTQVEQQKVEEIVIEVEEKEKEVVSLANDYYIYGVVALTMCISIILIISVSLIA